MEALINANRLGQTFLDLAATDSPSLEEGDVAYMLKKIFGDELGYEVKEDGSSEITGSEANNMVVHIGGERSCAPLFINAHLDTVEPGRGVKPKLENGMFRSDGTTVLGADDKAAIAVMVEIARVIKEKNISHGPLEYLFTVCEEIGLLGAKALDPSFLRAKNGYALDSTDPDVVINRAPGSIRFKVKVTGKAAHAGLHPENGINAIKVAARAISQAPVGQIDDLSTANIGLISGGTATNIVPEKVIIHGEVRSHIDKRVIEIRDEIFNSFQESVAYFEKEYEKKHGKTGLPLFTTEIVEDYPLLAIHEDHPLITTAFKAGEKCNRNLRLERTGGGSDANIFNGKGFESIILGIGMQKVHSTDECISLEDMVNTANLVLEIIQCWEG